MEDPSDPALDPFRRLNQPDFRERFEAASGLFVAEGPAVVARLAGSRFRVASVLVDRRRWAAVAPVLGSLGAPVLLAPPELVEEVAGFPFHRGVLASVERGTGLTAEAVLARAGVVLVAEGVNDHENLGALFRNAAALGARGVLLSPDCADPLYRRSVRVSMGAVLHLPFATFEPWPEALASLRPLGIPTLALTPQGEEDLEAFAGSATDRLAILVGSEARGLTPQALERADHQVSIAMSPGMDSLNVATAAALALYRVRAVATGEDR